MRGFSMFRSLLSAGAFLLGSGNLFALDQGLRSCSGGDQNDFRRSSGENQRLVAGAVSDGPYAGAGE